MAKFVKLVKGTIINIDDIQGIIKHPSGHEIIFRNGDCFPGITNKDIENILKASED